MHHRVPITTESYAEADGTLGSGIRLRWRRLCGRRMYTATLWAAPLVLACGGGGTDSAPPPLSDEGEGVVGAWVRSGSRVRTYALSRPTSTSGPTPLLIVLHGSRGEGAEVRDYSGFDRASASHGFLVAYPDGVIGSWAVGCDCTDADRIDVDDVRFVRTLVDQIESEIPLDRSRIYVAGFSQGSMMAQRLACDAADLIAGFAAVAAGTPRVLDGGCSPPRPVPAVFIHGVSDPTVSWSGTPDLWPALESAAKWAERNGCASVERVDLPDLEDDGTHVWLDKHTGCRSSADVHFYGIEGGGHTWPGTTAVFPESLGATSRDISATDRILAFFNKEES